MKPQIIAIIPARGGSKGLPGKNIIDLEGTPLIGWSIAAARAAALIDDVVVTTDSPEIAEVCESLGATIPYRRPAELATDTACVGQAVQHVHDYLLGMGRRVDITVVLFPTHPFRTPQYLNYLVSLCLLGAVASETMHGFWWDCRNWYALSSPGDRPQAIQGTGAGFAGHKFQLAGVYRHTQIPLEFSECFAREDSFHYGIDTDRAQKFRADQLVLASQIAYPITDPVLRHDIDTPEDLNLARRYIREQRVPWTPGRACPQCSKGPLTGFGDIHSFLFPGTRAAELSVPNEYTLSVPALGRTENIQLNDLPSTPRELRALVLQRFDCQGQGVWIRQKDLPEQRIDTLPSVPCLILDKNRRIPTGIGRIYSRRGRAYMARGITLHSDTELTFAREPDGGLVAVLSHSPRSGDCLRIRHTPANGSARSDILMIFTNGSWFGRDASHSYKSDSTQQRITLDLTSPEGETSAEWFTDGLNSFPSGQLFNPITVSGWTRYDEQTGEWFDAQTERPIRGRQFCPPIFAWTGAAFLPAQQTSDDQWHFL